METLDEILEKLPGVRQWESTGEMTSEIAEEIANNIDTFMGLELGLIDRHVDTNPQLAFAQLTRLTLALNAAVQKKPSIVKRLEKWVNRIKTALRALGKKLGANGFSIGVGFPAGVSIDLSFPI